MKTIRFTAFILTIIGALNWGLVGVFHFDLVGAIFGEMSVLTRIIYSLVGASGILLLFTAHEIFTEDI